MPSFQWVALRLLVPLLFVGSEYTVAQFTTVSQVRHSTSRVDRNRLNLIERPIGGSVSARETEQYRLPNDTIPEAYVLELRSGVHLGDFNYNGRVSVRIRALRTTRSIVLHSSGSRITGVRLQNSDQLHLPIDPYVADPETETITITTGTQLLQGTVYQLIIDFESVLRDDVVGFYRITYPGDEVTGGVRYGAVTQFQAVHARSAFPCYDEPGLRAPFTITIESGFATTVYSNMPVASIKIIGDDTKQTRFQTTPSMPTYLVAFAITDGFASNRVTLVVDSQAPNINMELLAPDSSSASARSFALNRGAEVIRILERHFNQTYDLPKLDQLAVPNMYFAAMENWGLVTYAEAYLLYDEATGTNRDKENVIATIVHEFVHQFLGNLLTPHWWSDLFLSEGFATFYEYYLSAEVEPNIRFKDAFTVEALQTALLVDSASTIRPLSYWIDKPTDIERMFDIISYQKGGSVLRMIHHALGERAFLKGVRHYIQNNKGRSVTPDDLFESLQFGAAEDVALPLSLDVATIMHPWVYQPGYPLVTVQYQSGELVFRQERYTTTVENDSPGDRSTWWIPIRYQVLLDGATSSTDQLWLPQGTSQASILDVALPDGASILVNPQQTGYYRVNYDTDLWLRLIRQLNVNPVALPAASRGQLLDDGCKLYFSDRLDASLFFSLLQYTGAEVDSIPWRVALSNDNLGALRNALVPVASYFDAFARFLVAQINNIFEQLTFDEIPGEPHEFQQLRSVVIEWSCRMGVVTCRTEALTRMLSDFSNTVPVPDYLRESVYCGGMVSATLTDLTSILTRMQVATNRAERSQLIAALGCAENADFHDTFLRSLFENESSYLPGEWYEVLTSVYSKSAVGFAAFNRWLANYPLEILLRFGTDPAFANILVEVTQRQDNVELHYELVQLFMQFQAQ
ncbi:aminopeptidase N-like [Anopheles bellator]|uniref:aminopeptidase N-like n=1 Tax=Anopheles bellator TaxID=139047 RepID=UPI00264A27D5|nr:aminopeptidase N-like [Anopheles bellator]